LFGFIELSSTEPGHPSAGRNDEYQQKLGHEWAHHTMPKPSIRGVAA